MSVCIALSTYRINACTRDKYVLGTCHYHRPGFITATKLVSGSTGIIGIPREKANDCGKGGWRRWSRLVVRRFGLQHTSVYVCCRVEIILIEHRVLGCSAIEPSTMILVFRCSSVRGKWNKLTRWALCFRSKSREQYRWRFEPCCCLHQPDQGR